MSDFCAIIPTRGDRPQLLDFCLKQLDRMTTKPEAIYLIDDAPLNGSVDICLRIQRGIYKARIDGFDKCYIIEDDDFYDADYFQVMAFGDYDFVGSEKSFYYNIRNRTFEYFSHPNRSSLYNTGFRISALDLFRWPEPDTKFLDIKLWKYAKRQRKKMALLPRTIGVGIKHGIGLCAGRGHSMVLAVSDPDMAILRSRVDDEAFDFYQSL